VEVKRKAWHLHKGKEYSAAMFPGSSGIQERILVIVCCPDLLLVRMASSI
jgi:hypothetical protein